MGRGPKRRRPPPNTAHLAFKGELVTTPVTGLLGQKPPAVQHPSPHRSSRDEDAASVSTAGACALPPVPPLGLPSRSWRGRPPPPRKGKSPLTGPLPSISASSVSSVVTQGTPASQKVAARLLGPQSAHASGLKLATPIGSGGLDPTAPVLTVEAPKPAQDELKDMPEGHPELEQPVDAHLIGASESAPAAAAPEDFDSQAALLREIGEVERNVDRSAVDNPWQVRPGVPNVVHKLFHKMQCKSTQLYKDVLRKATADLFGLQHRVRELTATNTSINRSTLPGFLRQLFPKARRMLPADIDLLFNFLDADNHGEIEGADISNGLLILLSDDVVALLQRCRLLVSDSPQQSLMLITRYEMQLLVGALLAAYIDHPDLPLMKRELTALVEELDFSMRGRVQMSLLQKRITQNEGRMRSWFQNALDHYSQTAHPELSSVTFHEQMAVSLTEEERVFTSRKDADQRFGDAPSEKAESPHPAAALAGTGADHMPADMYAVQNDALQHSLALPKPKMDYEGLRGTRWIPCRFISPYEPTASHYIVEWEDGYIGTLAVEKLRDRPGRKQKSGSLCALVGLMRTLKKTVSPPSSRLAPVAPLAERIQERAFNEAGFVKMPAVFRRRSSLQLVQLNDTVRKLAGTSGAAVPQGLTPCPPPRSKVSERNLRAPLH